MVFSGLDDSFERFYQAVRRAYRFGQTDTVHVHLPVVPELEGVMLDNLKAKQDRFESDVAAQERHYVNAVTERTMTPTRIGPRGLRQGAGGGLVRWQLTWRADPRAAALADRHYSRKTPGAAQFSPPGRCLPLILPRGDAVWVTSWPLEEYTLHGLGDAWVCTGSGSRLRLRRRR